MAISKSIFIKIFLALFGIAVGLVGAELALSIAKPWLHPKGTEFASLDEVRRAMLTTDSSANSASTEESVDGIRSGNLRAIVNPHPNDKIIYDLRPDLNLTFIRANVRTNSCGMRYPEVSIPKAANTYRIALLGDSFAFGWGVEQNESFASRLEQNLNRLSAGSPQVQVLNFGVPGYATFQEVALFKDRGLEFEPDAVLVFFVQNDFELPFYVQDVFRPGSILSSSEFLRLGTKILDPKLEEQKMVLKGLDPNSALRELSDICRAKGIKLFLTINPRKEWRQWRDRLTILKERPDITLLNLRPEFVRTVKERAIASKDLTLSFDPHPSPLRHGLYGDLLTPYFMDILQP